MFKRKSESGRSMVEMLGVLAIIGVLSIGGIAGYTMSMRKYRANQMADALNKYALLIYNSCQKGIIDGTITSLSSCVQGESFNVYPADDMSSFMGEIGYRSIIVEKIGSNLGRGSILENTGIDSIRIRIDFPDQAICKAAALVMGTVDSSFSGWNNQTGNNSIFPGNRCDDSIPWITTQFDFK